MSGRPEPLVGTRVVARLRGDLFWATPFIVRPREWRAFYRHARQRRNVVEYARVVRGEMVSVL